MSDVQYGPGWWLASDGKWYRPEQRSPVVESPRASAGPGRKNVAIVVGTIAVGVLVVAAAFVLTRGDSKSATVASDGASPGVTAAPAVVLPSAPEAVKDTTDYNAILALGIVDTFTSSTTIGGQNVDVVIDMTEIFKPGQSFGVNVHGSVEGNVLFKVPTNAGGEVQATYTLLDPATSSPSDQLTVFFTSEKIDKVFLIGSGGPVELVRT